MHRCFQSLRMEGTRVCEKSARVCEKSAKVLHVTNQRYQSKQLAFPCYLELCKILETTWQWARIHVWKKIFLEILIFHQLFFRSKTFSGELSMRNVRPWGPKTIVFWGLVVHISQYFSLPHFTTWCPFIGILAPTEMTVLGSKRRLYAIAVLQSFHSGQG